MVKTEFFYVQESKSRIDWQLLPGDSTIGTYLCKRATAFVRGRRYEAWYTPDIPISDGPWKLYGLPGLILAAADSTKEVRFTVKHLAKSTAIAAPKRLILPAGKQFISREQYLANVQADLKNFVITRENQRPADAPTYLKGSTSTISIQPTGIEIWPVIATSITH